MPTEHSRFLPLANQFFHWSLRRPSGGILNILFMPTEARELQMNPMAIRASFNFFHFVLFNTTTDLPALGVIPEGHLHLHGVRADPNREGIIIWPPIIIFALTSTLLTVFGCCFRCYKLSDSKLIPLLASVKSKRRSKICLHIAEILLFIECVILVLATLAFLAFNFDESNGIISLFDDTYGESGTLIGSLNSIAIGLRDFLVSGLVTGRQILNEAFEELERALIVNLQNHSSLIIDAVYRRFRLQELLTIQAEIGRLIDLQVAITKSLCDELADGMQAVANFVVNLTNTEENLLRVLKKDCSYVEQCTELIMYLDTSARQLTQLPHPHKMWMQILDAMKAFRDQFEVWNLHVRRFNQSLVQARSRLSDKPLSSAVSLTLSVDAVWRQMKTLAHSLPRVLYEVEEKKTTVWSRTAKTFVRSIFSSVGGLFVLLLLPLCFFVGAYLLTAVRERISGKLRRPREIKFTCRSSVVYLLVLLLIVTLVTTVLVICATFGSSFFFAEGCAYLQREEDLVIFDLVLNAYLRGVWTRVRGQTLFGLRPPHHLINAILRECPNKEVGLYALIGWKNFPGASTILLSTTVQRALQHRRRALMEILLELNRGLSSEWELSDLNKTLRHLSAKHNLGVSNLEKIALLKLDVALLQKVSKILPTLVSTIPGISNISKAFQELSRKAPTMLSLVRGIGTKAESFQSIEEVEVMASSLFIWLTNMIKDLKNSSSLDNVIADIYADITQHLNSLCERILQPYVQRLFQCRELARQLLNLTELVCGSEGLLPRFFVWGVIVWIEVVLLAFLLPASIFTLSIVNDILGSATS